MIQSIWQIDLINASGTTRLLDYGDLITDELAITVAQSAKQYSAIGSTRGETQSMGNAFVNVTWQRQKNLASHAAARNACLRTAADDSTRKTGALCISVQGGESWNIYDATVTSTSPLALQGIGFRTVTSYQAIGSRMQPAAALTLYAGIPWDWILQDWDDLTGDWDDL